MRKLMKKCSNRWDLSQEVSQKKRKNRQYQRTKGNEKKRQMTCCKNRHTYVCQIMTRYFWTLNWFLNPIKWENWPILSLVFQKNTYRIPKNPSSFSWMRIRTFLRHLLLEIGLKMDNQTRPFNNSIKCSKMGKYEI